jgi:hypothetical protein
MHDTSPQLDAQATTRAEYWSDHIQRWQDSGLSKAEYCRQNHLTKHAFYYWCKKLRHASQDEGSNQDEGSVVPLPFRVVDLIPGQPSLVLNIGQRFQVAIQGDFQPSVLKKLIKTLEGMA